MKKLDVSKIIKENSNINDGSEYYQYFDEECAVNAIEQAIKEAVPEILKFCKTETDEKYNFVAFEDFVIKQLLGE